MSVSPCRMIAVLDGICRTRSGAGKNLHPGRSVVSALMGLACLFPRRRQHCAVGSSRWCGRAIGLGHRRPHRCGTVPDSHWLSPLCTGHPGHSAPSPFGMGYAIGRHCNAGDRTRQDTAGYPAVRAAGWWSRTGWRHACPDTAPRRCSHRIKPRAGCGGLNMGRHSCRIRPPGFSITEYLRRI